MTKRPLGSLSKGMALMCCTVLSTDTDLDNVPKTGENAAIAIAASLAILGLFATVGVALAKKRVF